ncbi:type II transport GspH family protein [Lysobacter capsici]|nr:type II transport GspH family protein [Lysobacter capsici]
MHMRRIRGLSLIEVVVALMIATLMLGFALPALGRIVDRAHVAHAQTQLGESFLTATRHAVASGSATVICPVNENGDCEEAPDWSRGWLVFADLDNDRRFGGRDIVIRRFEPVAGGLRLYSTEGRKRIVFQPQGDSAGTNVTFTLCSRRHNAIGQLLLSNTGRFRAAKITSDSDRLCI